ncbi:hypothetical protein [Streptomyces sp. NPDC019890]|uniref:hypothetical protein n=1 Tax=Streptomyces sp. NPDC019890 TaxID=3365064 RepID=UPI00384EA1D7
MTGHGHVHGHHQHHTHVRIDAALEGSAQGLRTLWFSFGVLAARRCGGCSSHRTSAI